MSQSKLEIYIDILKVLAQMGPLKLNDIAIKVKLNDIMLKAHLNFLVKQDLVEERTTKKEHTVFAVTQRSITVLKYFQELTKEIPDLEES